MKRFALCISLILFVFSSIASGQSVLLIPESTNDTVGMYDKFDGTYLGDLITGYAGFSTPINAIQGPGGDIYVSDQLTDAVYVFDTEGNYLSTYADDTDGLNNIRGIEFFGSDLYVTSGDDFIAVFSAPHVRETDFVNDGSDPFDVYFLDDGKALVSDIAGSSDNVRLYDATGTLEQVIFNVNFPEQIQKLPNGNFINVGFSANLITVFDMTGVISQVSFSGGRGAFELGNGNLIATNGDGVFELDPATGAIINTLRSGVSARFIEVANLGSAPTPTPTGVPCNNDGDTTLDDVITAGDAQLAFLIALGSHSPSFEEECAADCNGDETVTAGDAQQIFLTALGSASCVDPI